MQTKTRITGGHILLSRKIYSSAIWSKPPQYIKLWAWLLGRAAFKDGLQFNGHTLKRGELLTTYNQIAKSLIFIHNKAVVLPSKKELRIMIEWLENEGMISANPIYNRGLGTWAHTGAHTRAHTGAHLGIRICIINYDSYQDSESYKGTHQGTDLDRTGAHIKRRYKNNDSKTISPEPIGQGVTDGKKFDDDIMDFVRGYQEAAKAANGSRGVKVTDALISSGCTTIEKLIRIDGFTKEVVFEAVRWAYKDSFWSLQVFSLASLRTKGKNGLTKFQNILNSKLKPTTGECQKPSPEYAVLS